MSEQDRSRRPRAIETADPTETGLESVTPGQLEDQVIRLREWGTDAIHMLPKPTFGPWIVGTSSACAVRLVDRHAAPKHARLTYEATQWWISEVGASQTVRQEGVRRARFVLTPGVEVGIGATTLVAESVGTVRLRAFCQRLLGWGSDRLRAVDHLLRAMRLARARHSSLVLSGEGDLVPIAYALHRFMLGDAAPFIVCDRRRLDTRASVRSPANVQVGIQAFMAATGGSLCLRHRRLPQDVGEVLRRAYDPSSDVQLFVCTHGPLRSAALVGTVPIQLPPLEIREMELPRIIAEYATDAIAILGATSGSFTDADRRWVMEHSAQSLQDIEKATLRLVALRLSDNITQAADRLGMAPVSLTRWLERRPPLAYYSRARGGAVRARASTPRSLSARTGSA